MINFARRRLLQFIGAGAVAVPALPLAIPEGLAKAAPLAALAGAGIAGPGPEPKLYRLGPLHAEIEELRERHQDQWYSRRNSRVATGGFDPDIACMRSWSQSTKMRKQLERDDADLMLNRRISKAMWG